MNKLMDAFLTEVSPVAAPVRKQVEERLRRAIMSGQFQPGAHLVDRELCDQLKVSRTVVREAQRSLESEGLVVILPHRGCFVRTINYAEAVQIYDVRAVLEALAGQGFAQNATARDLADLRAVYAELRASMRAPETVDLIDIKTRFYAVLLRGSGNRFVEKMLNQMLNYNAQLRATSLAAPGRLAHTVEEIGQIVEAVGRRDPKAAWDSCFNHVQNAARIALGVLKQREDIAATQTGGGR